MNTFSIDEDVDEGVNADLPKEAFLYWIHCNRCFAILKLKQRRIFLLTCQHLSCDQCAVPVEGTANFCVCPICSKTVRGREINNNLPPYVKQLFHPHPWLEGLPTPRIMRFQMRHRQHFQQGMERVNLRHAKMQETVEAQRKSTREKFELLQNVTLERKRLEERVRQLILRRKREKSEERSEKRPRRHSTSSTVTTAEASGRRAVTPDILRVPSPQPATAFHEFSYFDSAAFDL